MVYESLRSLLFKLKLWCLMIELVNLLVKWGGYRWIHFTKLVDKMLIVNYLLLYYTSVLVCDVRKQQLEVATGAVQSRTFPDDYYWGIDNIRGEKKKTNLQLLHTFITIMMLLNWVCYCKTFTVHNIIVKRRLGSFSDSMFFTVIMLTAITHHVY